MLPSNKNNSLIHIISREQANVPCVLLLILHARPTFSYFVGKKEIGKYPHNRYHYFDVFFRIQNGNAPVASFQE